MTRVATPPTVSIASESGVTSSSSKPVEFVSVVCSFSVSP